MRARLLVFTVAVMLSFISSTLAQGMETVWSGLVMANNVPEPTPIPAELNRLEGTLKQLLATISFRS